MKRPMDANRGFTLVETLVVLAILTILAIVGISQLGSKPNAAVKATLEEIEGVLYAAHKMAVSTGSDVTLTSNGVWVPGTSNPMTLTYTGATPSEVFRYRVDPATKAVPREQLHAGVVSGDLGWYTTALGSTPALNTIVPGNAEPFLSALKDTNLLFKGTLNTVTINGSNKRFVQAFSVVVVGARAGQPIKNGPVGVIVVTANGSSIYKFYNSGLADGDGQWRRL